MKKYMLLFVGLFFVFPFNMNAQMLKSAKENNPKHRNISYHQKEIRNKKNNSYKKNNSFIKSKDLTKFQELPYQDPIISYYEASAIALSNGNILMFWASYDGYEYTADDTLFCMTSTDGGLTWINKKTIIHLPFNTIFYLTGLQFASGRIAAVWSDNLFGETQIIYSDDNGETWNTDITIPRSQYFTWYPSITQLENNSIYLSYSRNISGDFVDNDIVFRKSTDDGVTWSEEKYLTNILGNQNMGSITSTSDSGLLAIYSKELEDSWGIIKRTSSDEGDTWSEETTLYDSPNNDDDTRLLRISKDTLLLLYWNWTGYAGNYYFMISGDNGTSWNDPIQFTKYAGYDGYISNLCLYKNKPFVAFASARWQQFYNVPHIWYGTIGITEDKDPPPAVLYSPYYQYYFAPNKVETILGSIVDESGIKSVKVNISKNGGAEYSLNLYDDGEHNDWGIGDNLFGTPTTPFSLGDHIDYSFTISDSTNNTINVSGFSADILTHGDAVNPNGGFELTAVGNASGNIAGWYSDNGDIAEADFTVVDDVVKEGVRALRIEEIKSGENDWSIQSINKEIQLEPNSLYRYLIRAKAEKDSA